MRMNQDSQGRVRHSPRSGAGPAYVDPDFIAIPPATPSSAATTAAVRLADPGVSGAHPWRLRVQS